MPWNTNYNKYNSFHITSKKDTRGTIVTFVNRNKNVLGRVYSKDVLGMQITSKTIGSFLISNSPNKENIEWINIVIIMIIKLNCTIH